MVWASYLTRSFTENHTLGVSVVFIDGIGLIAGSKSPCTGASQPFR